MIKLKTNFDQSTYKKSQYNDSSTFDNRGDEEEDCCKLSNNNNNSSSSSSRFSNSFLFKMGFLPMMTRRRLKWTDVKMCILWIMSVLFVVWLLNGLFDNGSCGLNGVKQMGQNRYEPNVEFLRLQDSVDTSSNDANGGIINQKDLYPYNRNMPLIFIGGVPRSGTTLMRGNYYYFLI